MKQGRLVIGDAESMVALISDICGKHLAKVHVVSALKGRQGLQLARSAKPGVVVLKVNLPDITGLKSGAGCAPTRLPATPTS